MIINEPASARAEWEAGGELRKNLQAGVDLPPLRSTYW